MTDDLRAALEDLVIEVPRHVVPDDLTNVSWTTGRRRRRRRLVIRGVASLAVLIAVGALMLTSVPTLRPVAPASGGSGDVVDGYPERIGRQWIVHDLPDAPGPMAGLIWSIPFDGGGEVWYAFSAEGERWRLPVEPDGLNDPTISPDGTRIAYLPSRFGPYVIQNLVTGVKARFPAIASAAGNVHTKYQVYAQDPAFWSPDGQHLLVYGSLRNTESGRYLVLGGDGSIVKIAAPRLGWAAGWLSNESFAVVSSTPASVDKAHRAELKTVNLDGTVFTSAQLPFRGPPKSQFASTISPDRRELVVVTTQMRRNPDLCCNSMISKDRLYRYSLASGAVSSRPVADRLVSQQCPLAWHHDELVVSAPGDTDLNGTRAPSYAVAIGRSSGSNRVAIIYPGVHSYCIVWAGDALGGTRHGNVFGLSNFWLVWWWHEVLAATLMATVLLALCVWGVRWWRRRGWPTDDGPTGTLVGRD